MGTPEIAATCLKKIIADGFEIVGCYTQPDRPKGRGMKMVYSPVKEVALANPYQWAVLDGLKETGVSAQHMVLEMDAGDVIDVAKTPIGENDTAGEVLDRLAVLGADLLSRVLDRVKCGDPCCGTPQCKEDVTFAPMLDKSMCPIDWNKSAQQVHNHVRGLHPWPIATMELQGKKFKVHATRVVEGSGKPGQILGLTKTGLQIACGSGAVEILSLQAEGGKRMAAPDYFRGHPLEI